MDNALLPFETEESRWVSDIQRISDFWTKSKAFNWETFNCEQLNYLGSSGR